MSRLLSMPLSLVTLVMSKTIIVFYLYVNTRIHPLIIHYLYEYD